MRKVPMPEEHKPILAVTGSQRPYVFDLPHLLSLPDGFEFRFRYRHNWVEPGLLTDITVHRASLAGRELIILYHSEESGHVVPIRNGTVIGAEELGPMILLRFRVQHFARVSLDLAQYYPSTQEEAPSPTASKATDDLSARAIQFLGQIGGTESYDLSQPLPRGWYLRQSVCPSESSDWDHDGVAAAWARVVAVLHGDPNLFGLPFFYLLGFRTETGANVKPSAIENRFSLGREPIHGFALHELERYRMRVLEWCERPKSSPHPRVRLDCEFNPAHLALEGASNLVVGRYDVCEFTFSARQTGYSEVGVRADNLDMENQEPLDELEGAESSAQPARVKPAWTDWPTIFAARVPVVVKPKARRFITAALAGLIGLGLYIWVAPNIGAEYASLKSALELVALAILFFGYRTFEDHLNRFFKLSGALQKLRGSKALAKEKDTD